MFEIIRQGLTRRWVQSLSTILSITFSVAVLFALFRLFAGTSRGLDVGARRLGADLLVVPQRTLIESETLLFTGAPVNVYMPRAIEGRVAAVPGVTRTTAQFFAQTLNETCCSLTGATRLIGFDPRTDWTLAAWGSGLPLTNLGTDQIIVGAGVEGVAGGRAYVLGRILNVVQRLQMTGTSLDYSVLMRIDAVRELARQIPYLRVFLGDALPDQVISALLVEVNEGADKAVVAAGIEALGDVRVIRAADVFGNVKRQMKVLFVIMLGGGVLAALASWVQLFARFFSLAWDRKGEWGLYRALGATRADLKILVFGEAAIVTSAGVAAGLGLGTVLGIGIQGWLRSQRAFPFIESSTVESILAAIGLSAIFALLASAASWWAAHQSGKISPSSAMAMGDID